MQYLHTMVRVKDLDESLDFYCGQLGLVQISRYDSEAGQFTLIMLACTYSIIPAIFKFIGMPLLWKYPLTEDKVKEVQEEIARKAEARDEGAQPA